MTANHHGFPAGYVSPEAWEHAQRQAAEWELAREQEEAAQAAREQAISDRIAQRRDDHGEPVQATTASHDDEYEPVTK